MAWVSASFLVAVGLSTCIATACSSLVCLFLFRRLRRTQSIKLLRELSVEVSDLHSLYASLMDAHKRLVGRLAKSALKRTEEPQETSESPQEWKQRMRAQMAANQLSGRHPAAGISGGK